MLKKNFRLFLILQLFLTSACFAQDLLTEDQAFKLSATVIAPDRIQAVWQIADGYYMYRDKMAFQLTDSHSFLSPPVFPNGDVKWDPLFGEVEVYTNTVVVELAVIPDSMQGYQLVAKGQGCNEPVGICYPPMTRQVTLTSGPLITEAASSATLDVLKDQSSATQSDVITSTIDTSTLQTASDLRSLLAQGFDQQAFLDVDQAFNVRLRSIDQSNVTAVFRITDGYYLYRNKIDFSDKQSKALKSFALPEGKIKNDEYFGEVAVFTDDFEIPVKLNPSAGESIIDVTYQGCAEQGICYSPVTKSFDLAALTLGSELEANIDSNLSFNTDINQETDSAEKVTTSSLSNDDVDQNKSLTGILFGALIAGLLLTFTPCVLPLIPILSSVIAGQGKHLTQLRGGILAAIYVAGTMVTYAAMGYLAGQTGDQLQAYFQNIWAIGILSILFFVMALSMFGFFEIQMPVFIQSALQAKSNKLGGSAPMVFVLGTLSALIVGACVSPVLISFLGIAVSSGDPVLGAQIMLVMALGMGIPLIALGFGAGHFIPRAGQWMEKVKQGFGVMLIGVAIYMLGVLPQIPVLLLWGSFFIILSIFLGATQNLSHPISVWSRLEKGVGIVMLVWGIFLLAGNFLGQRDILNPIPSNLYTRLAASTTQSYIESPHLFTQVENVEQLEYQMQAARVQNKLLLVDYYADWCVECVRMEQTTFQNPDVLAALNSNFISIQVDLTDPNDQDKKALKKRFNVFGPPATLFIDRDGKLLRDRNFYGYMNSEEFLNLISAL